MFTKFTTKSKLIAFGILLFSFTGCTTDYENEIPNNFKSYENLIVINLNEDQEYNINFDSQLVFGKSEGLKIGQVGSFTVDHVNNVYIVDTQLQKIYIFNQYGHHIDTLGGRGRGPGDFQFIGYLKIVDDLLFAHDPPQFRYTIFSIDNFEQIEILPFYVANKSEFDELNEYNLGFMYPVNKSVFLGSFSNLITYSDPSHPKYNVNKGTRHFYLIDKNGTIISDKLFEYPDLRALTATVNGEHRSTKFEFLGQTLISVSNNAEIYIARNKDFFIKILNSEGEYKRSFYIPFQREVFTREVAIRLQEKIYNGDDYVLNYRSSVIRNAPEEQIPKTWPAIDNMLLDDESRLWVSTIVEDFDIYEWWVLEKTGELITRFEWPRDEPIEVINNGFMYTRQTDEETGLQQIVRYRIELEEV